jgi:septum formation topological specificity factor MinE
MQMELLSVVRKYVGVEMRDVSVGVRKAGELEVFEMQVQLP